MSRAAADAYLENHVATASPERLHLMVVDAAIRYARRGMEALANRDFEATFLSLGRARDCINEILSGIRDEPLRDLAERLRGLFLFAHRSLTRADLLREPQHIHDALVVLEAHRQTWLELIEQLQQKRVAPMAPHHAPGGSPAELSWTT